MTYSKKQLSASSKAYLKRQADKKKEFKAERKRAARLRSYGAQDPYKRDR